MATCTPHELLNKASDVIGNTEELLKDTTIQNEKQIMDSPSSFSSWRDQRPTGCTDKIWESFVDIFGDFAEDIPRQPDLFYWNQTEESLEVCFSREYVAFFVESDEFSCCHLSTGTWHVRKEDIRSLLRSTIK